MDVKAAARELNLSDKEVYRLIKSGKLPAMKGVKEVPVETHKVVMDIPDEAVRKLKEERGQGFP